MSKRKFVMENKKNKLHREGYEENKGPSIPWGTMARLKTQRLFQVAWTTK